MFFPSCKHLTGTSYVLGPVLKLRSQGSLHCKGGPGLRQDREFLLGQWWEGSEGTPGRRNSQTKDLELMNPRCPRPVLRNSQRLEHGVHRGPQGPAGFTFSVDKDIMQSPGPAFGPAVERGNAAWERGFSRQKLEGTDQETKPSGQRQQQEQRSEAGITTTSCLKEWINEGMTLIIHINAAWVSSGQ